MSVRLVRDKPAIYRSAHLCRSNCKDTITMNSI